MSLNMRNNNSVAPSSSSASSLSSAGPPTSSSSRPSGGHGKTTNTPIDYRQQLAQAAAGCNNSRSSSSSSLLDGHHSAASATAVPLSSAPSSSLARQQQLAPRFLVECAIKLHMKPLTSSTASILYHRFFSATAADDYDAFLIATSCLYLAGKLKDDPVKIRDVINVAHCTLNRGASPLELCDEYWAMRDGIVQAELLITRMLKFDLSVVHPHKYLLHFMATLQDWFGKATWQSLPVARTAAGFLQDFHSHPAILDYKPAHVACASLSLAFQTYGVQVPVTDEFDETLAWYNVFAKDLTKELHWELQEKIMEVYEQDEHQFGAN